LTNAWILLALAAFGAGDWTSTDSFYNVVPARQSDDAILALGCESLAREHSFVFYFKNDEAAKWQEAGGYSVILSDLVRHEDILYAFGSFGAAAYDLDGNPAQTTRLYWKLEWTPLCAAVVEGEFYAFGRIRDTGSNAGNDTSNDTSNDIITVAKLDDGVWVEQPELSLPQRTGPMQIAAVEMQDGSLRLFWIADAAGDDPASLICARFDTRDAKGWDSPSAFPLPKLGTHVAAARRGDLIHVFVADTSSRISQRNPIYYAAFSSDTQPEDVNWQPVAGLVDEPFLPTRSFAAALDGDNLLLYLASAAKLDTVSISNGSASARTTISEAPILEAIPGLLLIVAIIAGVYLLVFIVSIRRARHFPRTLGAGDHQIRLASWVKRVGAFIVDMAVFALFIVIVSSMEGSGRLLDHLSALTMGPVIMIPYFILLEADRGQSIGKRIFGIAVITVNFTTPGFKHAIIRNIFRFIPPAISLVVMLNTRTQQRIGDIFAGTLVIEVPRAKQISQHEEPQD